MENKIINLLSEEYEKQREQLKESGLFRCPICKEQVVLHWAEVPKKIPHFKHKPESVCIGTQSESQEHQEAKRKLFAYLSKTLEHKIKMIDIEYYIAETNQIADVYIEFTNGSRWAIEYQRSNMSPEHLKQRRSLYKKLGIRDIWIVGENVIKENGLFSYRVFNIGQAIISNTAFGNDSLVAFNPNNNKVSIYRGLERLNNRTYIVNTGVYHYDLDDICFNLWGEIFCFDDFLAYKESPDKVTYHFLESYKNFTAMNEKLYRSEVPGYTFKVFIEDQDSKEKVERNLTTPDEIIKYVPVEMKDINFSLQITYNSSQLHEINGFFVEEIYPSKWGGYIKENRAEKKSDFQNVTRGWLLFALEDIYSSKFQTLKDLQKEIKILENGEQIPFSLRNQVLQKHGLIDKPFLLSELSKEVSIEDCLLQFLKIANISVERENVKEVALYKGVVTLEELQSPFTIPILSSLVKRINRHILTSKDYHHATNSIFSET